MPAPTTARPEEPRCWHHQPLTDGPLLEDHPCGNPSAAGRNALHAGTQAADRVPRDPRPLARELLRGRCCRHSTASSSSASSAGASCCAGPVVGGGGTSVGTSSGGGCKGDETGGGGAFGSGVAITSSGSSGVSGRSVTPQALPRLPLPLPRRSRQLARYRGLWSLPG